MKRARVAIQFALYLSIGSTPLFAKQEYDWQAPPLQDQEAPLLTLTPSVCVVKQKHEICEQTLAIAFQSNNFHNICIYQMSQAEPIWCKKNVQSVELMIKIKVNKSIKLRAIDMEHDHVLATTSFVHSVFQPVNKRKRRNYGIGIL